RLLFFCFVFQAEDGIRDRNVTGVQTCALPIWSSAQTFAEADPAHAEQFTARAEDLIDRLNTLDEEFSSSLSDCRQDVIVVSHERSEERRVGKECRCRWALDSYTAEITSAHGDW